MTLDPSYRLKLTCHLRNVPRCLFVAMTLDPSYRLKLCTDKIFRIRTVKSQ